MKIICPHCKEQFELSASDQTTIMNQIRDHAFNEELDKREKSIVLNYQSRLKAELEKSKNDSQNEIHTALKEKDNELNELTVKFNKINAELKSEIESLNKNKELEVDKARSEMKVIGQTELNKHIESAKNTEMALKQKYADLEAKYNVLSRNQDLAIDKAINDERLRQQEFLNAKNQEINDLKMQYTRENDALKLKLESLNQNKGLEIKQAVIEAEFKQKEDFDSKVKDLQTELDYYKDLKAKMSTKMIGESLEQHCMTQFNQYRMMAFPNAYFEKDNEISKSGSKGDFIYREEMDGIELLSIMFEMKNENEVTATKHKNEDFLKELDKDRREKNCEYAILVSLLESDNEFYNNGIVDMSYKYPKMYVIRPQFFIQMIGILRNAALNSMDARRELKQYQDQNLDILAFQSELSKFQGDIGRNYELASKKFSEAITEIDKSIEHLQKVRSALVRSEDNLRLIDKKTQDMTMKKLTKHSPSLKEQLK